MRYIGLDVAYRNVGLAILDAAGDLVSREHLTCAATRDPEGFRWHAEQTALFLPDDIVAIEGLSFGSRHGKMHLLSGAHAIWLEAAFHQSSLVFVVPPQRVKIWAVDTAKAKKPEMIAWGRAQLQLSPKVKLSEHEADALALAQVARAAERRMRYRFVSLTKRQGEILQNRKGDGVLQKPDLSFYRGHYGKRYEGAESIAG